jgi:hypothetical protein
MIHVFINIFILLIKVRQWMKVWIDILCGKGMSRKGNMYNLYLIFAKGAIRNFDFFTITWYGLVQFIV